MEQANMKQAIVNAMQENKTQHLFLIYANMIYQYYIIEDDVEFSRETILNTLFYNNEIITNYKISNNIIIIICENERGQ